MPEFPFNIRVYGLWIQHQPWRVLITDEIRNNKRLTKFPGGGLQFGEGLREALKREWWEETGQDIETGHHFYTTDFFQRSIFDNNEQIISIYYFVHPQTAFPKVIHQVPYNFEKEKEGGQIFRWLSGNALSAESFTLPIEQKVAQLLMEKYDL